MDATEIVGELRSAVSGARAMPMSTSAVVNRGQLLGLLDRLEQALDEAEEAGGHRDAAAVLADARKERARLVSDSEVLATAQRQAQELLEEARAEVAELRRETDDYVDTQLAHLQVALTKTLEAVNRGRDRLSGRSDLANLGVDADEDPRMPSAD